MFDHILVPLDGSSLAESVLPHVIAVAKSGVATVTLLRVLDPSSPPDQAMSQDPFQWQVCKAEAEAYLKGIAARLQEAGVEVGTELREGKAAESVIEFARDNQIKMILLSSHGESGISGWNVSSVVQKVIVRARTSIMIVRAYHPYTGDLTSLSYKRILVPLDGSQRAEVALPVAVALAQAHQAQVLLAHVVSPPEMPRRTPPSQQDLDLSNQVIERNRVEAGQYLEEIQGQVDAPVETRLLMRDNTSLALHDLVEQVDADLVVLSAHGYSGETRWPYGSVVISFIAYGKTPLLVIQDLPPERLEPTEVELLAREHGGR